MMLYGSLGLAELKQDNGDKINSLFDLMMPPLVEEDVLGYIEAKAIDGLLTGVGEDEYGSNIATHTILAKPFDKITKNRYGSYFNDIIQAGMEAKRFGKHIIEKICKESEPGMEDFELARFETWIISYFEEEKDKLYDGIK